MLIACAAVMAIPLALTSISRFGGVCLSQWKRVADEQLIATGVANRAGAIKGFPENWTSEDVDAFVRNHPGCCRIVAVPGLGSGKWVQVLFELKPERVHASQPNDVAYEALVNVDECGQKVDFMGMPITLERMRWLRQHSK